MWYLWQNSEFDPEARIAPSRKKMADAIVHRGPDDEGYYIKGQIGLGFRRLSIIDLSGGHQPLSNEDGTIWIVFNGEIYNYKQLRADLVSKGHIFKLSQTPRLSFTCTRNWAPTAQRCYEACSLLRSGIPCERLCSWRGIG